MRGMVIRSVLVCLFLISPALAQDVNEAASDVVIDGRSAVVHLSVNSKRARQNIPVSVELVDTNSSVTATESRTIPSIDNDTQVLEFRLPLGDALERSNEDFAWYRLRYRVGESTGIVSLS